MAQIAASLVEFGFTNPVLADSTGIVAGHGRVLAARQVYEAGQRIRLPGGQEVPEGAVPVLDCTGWSDAQRRAYILADNQLAMNAGWDFDMLAVEIDGLRDDGFDLDLIGFDQQTINDLIGTPNLGPEDDRGRSAESVLDKMQVTIADPRTVVAAGDVWRLGRSHRLIVCGVMSDWRIWVPMLDAPDAIFVPYPGMFGPLAAKALTHKLVMVQPDVYVAGHILDRYEEAYGEGSIERLSQVEQVAV